MWSQAPRQTRMLPPLAREGQKALSFTWRLVNRSKDAGRQSRGLGRVNRRTPSVDRANEGRREEVPVGTKGWLSTDYARNARTENPSIAGKRRLAPSVDKVGAPRNAARNETASRDRSARRVTRTVQEKPEVDWLADSPVRVQGCPLSHWRSENDSPAAASEALAQRTKKLARNHKSAFPEKPIVPAMPHRSEASFPL